MANKILFVVEGDKMEPSIIESIKKLFPYENEKVVWSHKNHIYNLYKKLEEDPDLDIFSLVKENDSQNILENTLKEDFDQIYLFFDYDGHVGLSHSDGEPLGDDIIEHMLERFDNETEEGKLFISYPMAEALKHTPLDTIVFQNLKVKCKGGNCPNKEICPDRQKCQHEPHYKKRVNKEKPLAKAIEDYSASDWRRITLLHIQKMEYIVNGNMAFPEVLHDQIVIFKKQREDYIGLSCPHVSVLSGFPAFILDYYGLNRTYDLLNS